MASVDPDFVPRDFATNKLAASIIIPGPILVYGWTVTNTNAAAQNVCEFDADALPADGQVPIKAPKAAAGDALAVTYTPNGRVFDAGLVLCNSSTSASKTIGAADCLFDVQYDRIGASDVPGGKG